MPLSSTSRPSIRGRIITKLPATLTGAGGIAVEKINGIWTIRPDWDALELLETVPLTGNKQMWILDEDTGVFYRVAVQTLIDSIAAGLGDFEPLGEASGIQPEADNFTFSIANHKGKIVESTKATAMAGTIPPHSDEPFPVKTRIDLTQYGEGQFSLAAGAGVIIRSADNYLKLRTRFSGGSLYQRAVDE